MEKITQAELIRKVSEETHHPQATVKKVLAEAVAQIVGHANNGIATAFPGLGTFSPKNRAARTGRNPKTGEPAQIPAKRVLTFKSSSKVELSAE